jgi:UDP-glucose 4-epimerase
VDLKRSASVVDTASLERPSHTEAWAHELEAVGTLHLLRALHQTSVQQLIYASTTLLYGALPSNPNYLSERHALRARPDCAFLHDKMEAEQQVIAFAERSHVTTTTLRMAPILGPTVDNLTSRYLARKLVPTAMGFDPLVQFTHEVDAVTACKLALDRAVPGTFNAASEGVLPLSTVIRLTGRLSLPVPHPLLIPLTAIGWALGRSEAPYPFIDFLRFMCLGDLEHTERQLGFRPVYSTREAVLDFAQRSTFAMGFARTQSERV